MNTNRMIKTFFSLNFFFIVSYSYGMQDETALTLPTPSEEHFWKQILQAKKELPIRNKLFPHRSSYTKQLNTIDDNLKTKLENLINDGVNPNTKRIFYLPSLTITECHQYPLSETVQMNLINSTALLIEKKGDLNCIPSTEGNLLHVANSAEMVTLLIQSGVDPKTSTPTEYNFFNSFVCSDLTTLEDVQTVYETYVPEIKKTNPEGIEIPLSTKAGIIHNLAYEAKKGPKDGYSLRKFIDKDSSLYKKTAYLMSLGVHNSYKDSNGLTPQQIINTTGCPKLNALFNDPKVQKKAIKEIQINQENIFTQLKKRESGRLNKIKLH